MVNLYLEGCRKTKLPAVHFSSSSAKEVRSLRERRMSYCGVAWSPHPVLTSFVVMWDYRGVFSPRTEDV